MALRPVNGYAAFNACVPTFPIRLGYVQFYKLENHPDNSFEAMLKNPKKSFFYEAWKSLAKCSDTPETQHIALGEDSFPTARPVGAVVPYGGFPGGLVVYDDFTLPRAGSIRHRVFQFETPEGTFTIQRYLHLLAAISNSAWTLDKPLEQKPPERISRAHVLRQVRGATQKLVSGLFIDILNGDTEKWPDWTARVLVKERIDGTIVITLTHQEIGDALGLELHQVRRALRSLSKDAFISKLKHGYRWTGFYN